jgi:D-arabinose 1-dehydrogenase-like Zn-dependent alcohol dehydrogenase
MVEQDIPDPGARQVRIKTQACNCHSDSVTKEGLLPGIDDPRIPGREIAGIIDAIVKHVINATPVASIPD